MKEIWKDVADYNGLYKVSNLGRIKSLDMTLNYNRHNKKSLRTRKGKILSPVITKNGYMRVIMSKNGKHKLNLVHRIVAKSFIPNPRNYNQVNHINCNKLDNRADNLEWCSCKQNMEHAWKNNLYRGKRVAKCKDGKIIAIYNTIIEASKSCGSKTVGQNISKVIHGFRKSAFGYQWKEI